VLSETDKRVTVVLDDAGIYAVYLVCTHLGCTPNYVTDVTTGSGVSPPWPGGGVCAPHAAAPKRLGVPVITQPLFHRFDQLLRRRPGPDGLGQHLRNRPDGFFRGRPGALVPRRGGLGTTCARWRLLVGTQKSNGKTLGV